MNDSPSLGKMCKLHGLFCEEVFLGFVAQYKLGKGQE